MVKFGRLEYLLKAIKAKFNKLRGELPAGTSFQETVEKEIMNDFFPPAPSPNIKSKEIMHAIVDLKGLVAYGDLTGKFPYRSTRGNQYILVGYNYDANHILAFSIKNTFGRARLI